MLNAHLIGSADAGSVGQLYELHLETDCQGFAQGLVDEMRKNEQEQEQRSGVGVRVRRWAK